MEPSSLRRMGKPKSEWINLSPPEQSQPTDPASSGTKRKTTIPLKPFRLTEEEKIIMGAYKGKSPKPSSVKRELKPFRISEYLPDDRSTSKKNVIMPSGTIVETNKSQGGPKRRPMLPSPQPKNPCNPLPIKTLFQSPKKPISVKVSQLRRESMGKHRRIPKITITPAEPRTTEKGSSTPLLNVSDLEEELIRNGCLSDTPTPHPTNDPVSLLDEMIAAENEALKNDIKMHEENICKFKEMIAAEKKSIEQRQTRHRENIQKLENLFMAIKTNNKENDPKAVNVVEEQSPRTKAALKMYKFYQMDHPLVTPKSRAQNTPGGDLAKIRLDMMKECWLLQETPRK